MKNGPVIKVGPGEEFPDNTPKQYLQGWVEFYKLKFKVTPDVLIPRPETELLVDAVLHYYTLYPRPYTLLDLGTGAGNIAISLAKNLPKAKIFATDISSEALEIANQNARIHRVDKRIFFIQSDLLSFLPNYDTLVYNNKPNLDIIVTNLPYIPSARIPYLDPSVKDFEPYIALNGGPDGFELYRKLFTQIKEKFLSPVIPNPEGVRDLKIKSGDLSLISRDDNGLKLLVCEIDYTHGELAVIEALKFFPEAKVEVKTDLAKKQRILLIQLAALPGLL